MKLNFIKTEDAKKIEEKHNVSFTPTRQTKKSVGYDLSACIEDFLIVYPKEFLKIPTGIKLDISSMEYNEIYITHDYSVAAFLYPRSSIKGLTLTNAVGVIDTDYQGEIILSFYNYTDGQILVVPGQRLAQLVFTSVFLPEMEEVELFDTNTIRGCNGFGSTGI